jgi:hypothetical protein
MLVLGESFCVVEEGPAHNERCDKGLEDVKPAMQLDGLISCEGARNGYASEGLHYTIIPHDELFLVLRCVLDSKSQSRYDFI